MIVPSRFWKLGNHLNILQPCTRCIMGTEPFMFYKCVTLFKSIFQVRNDLIGTHMSNIYTRVKLMYDPSFYTIESQSKLQLWG